MNQLYSQKHQFEPLLPGATAIDRLLAKAHELLKLTSIATGRADTTVMQSIAPLLRQMNSYYTNKIEGQHTLPSELESAVKKEFSPNADVQRKQRMALAHIDTEVWAEQHYAQTPWQQLFEPQVISDLHLHLFSLLPDADRMVQHQDHDRDYVMQPGQWRTAQQQVKVNHHEAPDAGSVLMFLRRFADFYQTTRVGELAVVAVAAAHHRLAWVHPFPDGNGRVARLQSHLLLHRMGLTNGVWSPLRGLARTQTIYYQRLAEADMPRHGDLDGRGNLSEKTLVAFIDYFLDICIDQARFMTQMLNIHTMRERIRACLAFESANKDSGIRMEAELALHMLFIQGPMERGEFKQITGLGLRNAERLIKALQERQLVRSDTPRGRGKLIFGVPHHALRFYFPSLWPEAEAQGT
jgi:Fic family protein